MGLPAQAAPTSQKAQDFQSHFPCHWVPSPTRLLLFPAAPLRPPLGREERLVGPPWNSKPFPGQQEAGPGRPWAVATTHALKKGAWGHADFIFCTGTLAGMLVTSSHRGHVKRGPRASLAWRACAAGHRPNTPPTGQHRDPAHLPTPPCP